MRYILSLILSGSLLFTACTSAKPQVPHEGHTIPQPTEKMRNLTVQDQSDDTAIRFVILDDGNMFTDFGISHTKEMHLIVVRSDLQHFYHLHPTRDSKGIWSVPFTPPASGDYWIYADFVEAVLTPHTLRFERTYQGKDDVHGIAKNNETEKIVDGYHFIFQPVVSSDSLTFTYTISDSQGQPVVLEEYLGAMGHSVLISPSGDFIHTHPSEGDTPIFSTANPPDDFYRVFTQFKIKGNVITVNFDWQRP